MLPISSAGAADHTECTVVVVRLLPRVSCSDVHRPAWVLRKLGA